MLAPCLSNGGLLDACQVSTIKCEWACKTRDIVHAADTITNSTRHSARSEDEEFVGEQAERQTAQGGDAGCIRWEGVTLKIYICTDGQYQTLQSALHIATALDVS